MLKKYLESNALPVLMGLLLLLISTSPRIPLPIFIPGRTFDVRFEDFFLAALILCCFLCLCLSPRIYLTSLWKPFLAYLLVVIATITIALCNETTIFSRAFFYTLKEVQFIIIYLLAANFVRSEDALKKVVWAILFVGLLNALWGIVQILTLNAGTLFNISPPQGIYLNPQRTVHYGIGLIGEVSPLTVAGFYSLISFLAYSQVIFLGDKKLFYLLLGLLFTGCAIYSGEKISIVFFAICAVTLMILSREKVKYVLLALASVMVLVSIIQFFLVAQGTHFESIERVFFWKSYIGAIPHRIETWMSFFQGGGGYLLGIGKAGHYQIFEEAHNHYIRVLLEAGVGGLFCFLWILVSLFNLCRKTYQIRQIAILQVIGATGLSALLAMSLAGMVQDAFKPVLLNELFWFIMGLNAACYRIGWRSRA